MPTKPPGLFVTATDTSVGKTYVSCRIAEALVSQGIRVGVYKPAESGIEFETQADSRRLWEAAGRPENESLVCPQRFRAPVAPHVAAQIEGRQVDANLLRAGIEHWLQNSDFVIVEGAGGLMSPITDDLYVADLALDFGFPLLVVAPNELGVINQSVQALLAAAHYRGGMAVAGMVLNQRLRIDVATDPSIASNRAELAKRIRVPVLAELPYEATAFDPIVDWLEIAEG